jgi:hypothetical protein
MIMRINPYVGISRMRRFRMVDMCKGERKLWLPSTDDVLVVGLHMVGKRMKVSSLNNVTSFFTLLFFFFHLIHPSHIFLATLLFSFSSFSFILSFSYFFLTFLYFFFLSFPYSYFSLYFPSIDNFSRLSTHLFLSCIQSEILNKSC